MEGTRIGLHGGIAEDSRSAAADHGRRLRDPDEPMPNVISILRLVLIKSGYIK